MTEYACKSCSLPDMNRNRSSYRSIAVHLDGSAEDETRIVHAETIANYFDAKVTGVFTSILPETSIYGSDGMVKAGLDFKTKPHIAGEDAFEKLHQRFQHLSCDNALKKIEEIPHFLYRGFARESLWNDLVIASCPYRLDGTSRIVEAMMLHGVHGLYLTPRHIQPKDVTSTVLVGWNDSREAARAISEAMPFLVRATEVHLVCVKGIDTAHMSGPESMTDIANYLRQYGIQTDINMMNESKSVANSLLEEAHRVSADLIVMGAYGHFRLREWLLGGSRVDMIRTTDIPVLMAS